MSIRTAPPRELSRRKRRFQVDDRVVITGQDGKRMGGWITAVHKSGYRVVTDSYKRLKVNRHRITRGRQDVLLLEARLDSSLRSHRHQGTFLTEFLKPFDIKVLYEKVHTREDLKKFLEMARNDPNIPYIHYVGHGDFRGRAKVKLTFGPVDLKENVGIFSDLEGKIFIFSCCTVGTDRAAMRQLLKVNKARAIITYDDDIDDAYAFLAEALLYSRVFDTLWRPKRIAQKVKIALQHLQVTPEAGLRNFRSPLICFSAK